MTGGPHIPVGDRMATHSEALSVETDDEISTNTHTRDRFGDAVRTESQSNIGDIIASRYELREALGVGAYGEVFKAWDTVLSRIVAIKILRNTRANVIMQFKQEFRGVFELSHPNLVRVHKLGRDDSKWFIVMEFIDGVPITSSLRTAVPQTTASDLTRERTEPFAPRIEVQREHVDGRITDAPNHTNPLISPVFSLKTVRDRIGQLVQGTSALHRFGILHCDLKPSNIMVNSEGRVVILDFGASRYTMSLGAHYQHHWIRAGTRAYMAPEARTLRESTPGLDWYAIGVMLAEMLTGLHARVIASTPAPKRVMLLQEVAQNHPEYADMCELCIGLMHPTPALRAGYDEAIEACYDGPVPAYDESARNYTPAFRSRRKELVALDEAYAVFEAGRPHAVLIEGGAGSGKTSICEEFLRRISLPSDAPHVVVAHCKHDELLSYRAFDGIIDGLSAILRTLPPEELEPYLPLCTPTLCALFPTLRTVDARLDTTVSPTSTQDAFVGLQALLKHVADDHRLVIWVSDVEQADGDSLRWIARIFAPGQRPNAFLLLSRIPHSTLHDVAIDIDTLGYALPTITVEPVDAETANSAIRSWLPPTLRDNNSLVDAIRVASNGRLPTMHALSRFPDRDYVLPADIQVESFFDFRIACLDEEAQNVLHALAVSFEAVSARLLAFVTEQPPAHIDDILRDLLKQAFITRNVTTDDERYELNDATLRQRVLHGMSDSLKQHLHDRYATAGTTRTLAPMRPADVVAHLTHAKRYADAESYALDVATASEQGGAYDSAAKMYALLIDVQATQGQLVDTELRMRAVECNLNSGRLLDAAKLLEQLASEAESPDDATALYQRAAETYNICGYRACGEDCKSRAQQHHPKPAQRYLPRFAHILLLLTRLKRRLKTFDVDMTSQAPLNPTTLTTMRTYRMAGFDIGIVDPVRGFEFALRELELALDTGSRIPISRALAGLSTFVSAMGGKYRQLGRDWSDLAIELAHVADDRTSLEWAHVGQASVEYHGSNYGDAWTQMHSSYLWFRENTSQQWMMLAYTSVHLIYLAYMTGRIDALRALYYGEVVEARARNNRMLEATMTFSGFITWLIDDAPKAGRAALKRIEIPREGGLYRLHDFFIVQYLAELCLYEQRMDECFTHINALQRYERTVISRSMELTRMAARFLRGRLLLAHASHTGKIRHKDLQRLQSLAKSLCANEDMLVQGWGHQLLAGTHFIRDAHEHAAEHLTQTIELYETAGISLYVEVIRAAGRVMGLFPHSGDPYEALEQMGVVNPERFVRTHHPYI